MIRLFGLALVALSMSFVACSGGDKKKDEPAPVTTETPTMADNQAIVGTWRDGANAFTFNGDGTFQWQQSRPCGSPPCPTSNTNGTYQFRNGKLYLSPKGATDEVIMYTFSGDQNAVTLQSNKRGQTWSLNRSN